LFKFYSYALGQDRTTTQERFARQFFVRKRRSSAGILTDFKLMQRIPGEKFPQSAAVVIVRCCLKDSTAGIVCGAAGKECLRYCIRFGTPGQ
jgi:hypothetical protein